MNKHAYLIMAHNNIEQLIRLVRALEDERNDIYIHLDSNVKGRNLLKQELKSNYSKIELIERLNVNWGGFSLVRCELNLLKAAVMSDIEYSRYHLISGVDLPIKNQDYIHAFFKNNCGEYIRFDPKPISLYEDRVRYFYPFQDIIGRNHGKYVAFLELLQNGLLTIQRFLKVNRCKKISLFKGVNWFSITDNLASYVLSQENFIQKTFKYSLCADELFLQTIVMKSPYKNNIINCSLRHIDWEKGKPYTFRAEDYEELMNTEDLFARKFDMQVDAKIINMILNVIKQK